VSDYEYVSIIGDVAFDPEGREVNGYQTRRVYLNTPEGQQFYVTLWPQFENVDVKKGDVVYVRGSLTTLEETHAQFVNASLFVVLGRQA
jgi:hypothetical protein